VTEIDRKPVNDLRAPPFGIYLLPDELAEFPVQQDQFAVRSDRRDVVNG
jgi:hypothetical protein